MRKFILLLGALALAVGLTVGPEPADAHYLPEYTWYTASDHCTHSSLYGSYGSNGFAQMKFLSEGCSIYTVVEVTTAHSGHTHVQQCSLGSAIFNPEWWCAADLSGSNTVIQATIHGVALKVRTIACGGPSGCITRSHGAFE